MDKVKAMQTFVRIVEANSFTRAAESLDLPRAALTQTMQHLERHLGAQLLQRTTRRLSLTSEGERYYHQCTAILAAIAAAEADFIGSDAVRLRGRLRIDLPGALARAAVLPRIGELTRAHPELELVIGVGDRLADLAGEGIDCVLRVGEPQDSRLVARRIGQMRFVIAAAPDYLARRGTPATLDDLAAHQGINHFSGRTGRAFEWELEREGESRKVAVKGCMSVNEADANLLCALQGLGLAQLACFQARAHLAAGTLREVLPGIVPVPMPVSLLYARAGGANPRVRAVGDWLAGVFADHPDLCLPA